MHRRVDDMHGRCLANFAIASLLLVPLLLLLLAAACAAVVILQHDSACDSGVRTVAIGYAAACAVSVVVFTSLLLEWIAASTGIREQLQQLKRRRRQQSRAPRAQHGDDVCGCGPGACSVYLLACAAVVFHIIATVILLGSEGCPGSSEALYFGAVAACSAVWIMIVGTLLGWCAKGGGYAMCCSCAGSHDMRY